MSLRGKPETETLYELMRKKITNKMMSEFLYTNSGHTTKRNSN